MTGSDRTYNAIVWGHPDPPNTTEQPIFDKEFTSELGCVTPVSSPQKYPRPYFQIFGRKK